MTQQAPLVSEFRQFISILMKNAPANYVPWLIKLKPGTKVPVAGISWKNLEARLTIEEAVAWMEKGGNVGIAGMPNDPLVNMDQDGGIISLNEVKPTLTVITRSRVGRHGFYFCEAPKIPNIPTDDAGEVRSSAQSVVAAGGFVPTDPLTVPENERAKAGYYTLENTLPIATITFAELPKVFRVTYEKANAKPAIEPCKFDPKKATGKHSALFELTAYDICLREGKPTQSNARWGSLFHDSDTEANMSLSNSCLLQCWRHNRSFNALQALAVLSGYMSCNDAGSPHKGAGGGSSRVTGDDGAIWHAWLYAKTHGYLPIDDPIPVRAMHYIADKHLHFKAEKDKPLPRSIYEQVLKIVEDQY